jgi:hypothetical protein
MWLKTRVGPEEQTRKHRGRSGISASPSPDDAIEPAAPPWSQFVANATRTLCSDVIPGLERPGYIQSVANATKLALEHNVTCA